MVNNKLRGIQEIVDGIKVSGSIAREAGFELEQYESVLGSIIERTRLGGSQVGNALLFGDIVV
jgi:hypothetical protein